MTRADKDCRVSAIAPARVFSEGCGEWARVLDPMRRLLIASEIKRPEQYLFGLLPR
jgi:hypothetical protein